MRAGLPVAQVPRVPQGLKARKGPPERMVRKALKVPPVQRVPRAHKARKVPQVQRAQPAPRVQPALPAPRVHKVRKVIPGHKGRRGLMAPMGPGCQLVGPARKC